MVHRIKAIIRPPSKRSRRVTHEPRGGLSVSKISSTLALCPLPPPPKYQQHFPSFQAEPAASSCNETKPLDQLVSKFSSSFNNLNMWNDLPFGPVRRLEILPSN